MPYDKEKHHRHSIRLKDYDYSQPGLYFVTLCVQDRDCLFGEIVDGEMRLSDWGTVVDECWQWISRQYPYVVLDQWIVMPNHVHGIIGLVELDNNDLDTKEGAEGRGVGCRGVSRNAPTTNMPVSNMTATERNNSVTGETAIKTKRKTLGRLIGAFKTYSTNRIKHKFHFLNRRIWQRDFYDHIIRNEKGLRAIRRYIEANPWMWIYDPENANRIDPNHACSGEIMGYRKEEIDFFIRCEQMMKYRNKKSGA